MTNEQKQDFVGGLVATALAKEGIEAIIGAALKKVAKSPNTKMDQADVLPATELVTQKIQEEVQARVEHRTDTEENFRSRNVWGSVVGLVCAADVIYKMYTDDVTQDIMDYVTQIGLILSILTPMYSRFFAKKPLGR